MTRIHAALADAVPVFGLDARPLTGTGPDSNEMIRAGSRSIIIQPAHLFMPEPTIKNVSDTAFWIAHLRAVESERADALFRDPLASRLAGDRGREITAAMPIPWMVGWTVAIRTCIIDDYIQRAIDEGVDTVLNLGAGLDTRPYRMRLPESLHWIEADYPHLIEYKERLLFSERARCRLERAKVDLADHSQRRSLFERVNAQAGNMLVLTEGVVLYLSVDEAASLADDLKALDHVRYWVVDYFSAEAMKYRRGQGMRRALLNAPFRFVPADWFGFFREHGWQLREMRYLAEEGQRLRRPAPLPGLIKIAMKTWALLVSEERRKSVLQSMGYALLEPI